MPIMEITERSELDNITEENPNTLLILDFYATWCGPCKRVMPGFLAMAEEYKDIFFVKVDVDEADDLSEEYGIAATPTFIFVKSGETLEVYNGTDETKIRSLIEELK